MKEYKTLGVVSKVRDPNSYESLAVESDGGSSSYYTFERDDGETMETEEVVRCMVDNDFDLGNIVKATRRISEANAGRGKSGTSIWYDLNKIKYTATKLMNLLEGNDRNRNG